MNAKTSVLMSVYEKEKAEYLDKSIYSILVNQTQKPDEFVLVCDGPLTPELYEIIDKYECLFPNIFKTYKTELNEGLGKALNYGLSKCNNEIIIRADSDDICDPERIKVQYEYLDNHPDIAIISSYIDEFDDDWEKPKHIKYLPLSSAELAKMAKFRNPINHMAAAFRREAVLKIGSYHHLPFVEDYELWVRALINGYKLANIDKILVHARVGNGMVRRRSNKQYISSWQVLNKYMLTNRMINSIEYLRNMMAVRAFVYMPPIIKEILYNNILRK